MEAADVSEPPTAGVPNASVDPDSTRTAPEAPGRGQTQPLASEPETRDLTDAPTIIEIDDSPKSGLEFFPSEPNSPATAAAGAGPDGSPGRTVRSRRRRRRKRDWTGTRI